MMEKMFCTGFSMVTMFESHPPPPGSTPPRKELLCTCNNITRTACILSTFGAYCKRMYQNIKMDSPVGG